MVAGRRTAVAITFCCQTVAYCRCIAILYIVLCSILVVGCNCTTCSIRTLNRVTSGAGCFAVALCGCTIRNLVISWTCADSTLVTIGHSVLTNIFTLIGSILYACTCFVCFQYRISSRAGRAASRLTACHRASLIISRALCVICTTYRCITICHSMCLCPITCALCCASTILGCNRCCRRTTCCTSCLTACTRTRLIVRRTLCLCTVAALVISVAYILTTCLTCFILILCCTTTCITRCLCVVICSVCSSTTS